MSLRCPQILQHIITTLQVAQSIVRPMTSRVLYSSAGRSRNKFQTAMQTLASVFIARMPPCISLWTNQNHATTLHFRMASDTLVQNYVRGNGFEASMPHSSHRLNCCKFGRGNSFRTQEHRQIFRADISCEARLSSDACVGFDMAIRVTC